MVVYNDNTVSSNATVTANIGPAGSVTTLAISKVTRVDLDPYSRVVHISTEKREYEFQIPTGYTMTGVWDNTGNYTLTIAATIQ